MDGAVPGTERRAQLAKLNAQEGRFLDLVGDPDRPREKNAARLRAVRDELPPGSPEGALVRRVEDAAGARVRLLSFGPRATDKRVVRG